MSWVVLSPILPPVGKSQDNGVGTHREPTLNQHTRSINMAVEPVGQKALLSQASFIVLLIMSIAGAHKVYADTPSDLPPIEAYGDRASIRSMALSPDGSRIAFLSVNDKGDEALLVNDLKEGFLAGVKTDKVKANSVSFISNEHVILRASKTTRIYGFRNRQEFTTGYSFHVPTKKIRQLLTKTDSLFPAQSGIGRIIGSYHKGDQVLMPAYEGEATSVPTYGVYRVSLSSGKGKILRKGSAHTRDWIVEEDGTVTMREDYDGKSQRYEIRSKRSGKWKTVYKQDNADLPPISVVGATSDRAALVVYDSNTEGYSALRRLDFDGNLSKVLFQRDNADVTSIISGRNRTVYGVKYSGMRPSYEFFDPDIQKMMESLVNQFPDQAVTLVDWSDGFKKVLVRVAGSAAPDNYYVFEQGTNQLVFVASGRRITKEQVADVVSIEYKARDGLKIPAVLTLPPGRDAKNLPLIALPHGGPEAYDSVRFDWLAQYFASRGYAVFQPNFRGSTGFGVAHKSAGRGKWGREMQNDITDGISSLAKSGYIDAQRVCIVGASYGGYAALAGGAYTPDIYRCVAAIAPVSDLPAMMREQRATSGKNGWVYRYWTKVIGDSKKDRDLLRDVSPARSAETFTAPVLLIHGQDDTVVPMQQSQIMLKALKKAKKSVEFVRLKHGDHWLLDGKTRLATLQALDEFVAAHLGSD